ncbi:MAG: translation initiation factor IF-2 [Alphaproteobacteria bacterium]|nr:translation initiation factor IF-2 [Alphaproteobacteria bacterium]
MTDTKDTDGKGSGGQKPTLTLKRSPNDAATVRQSFSHGRTKPVVVEKKRSVAIPGKPQAAAPAPAPEKPKAAEPAPQQPQPQAQAQPNRHGTTQVHTPRDGGHARPMPPRPQPLRPGGMVLRTLTEDEKNARGQALAAARLAEQEARRKAEEDARLRAAEEERLAKEREAAAKRKAEEDARKAMEEEMKRRADTDTGRRAEPATSERRPDARPASAAPAPAAPPRDPLTPVPVSLRRNLSVTDEDEEGGAKKVSGGKVPAKPAPARTKAEPRRRDARLTVTRALEGEDERVRSLAAFRRRTEREKRALMAQQQLPAPPREIVVPEALTVQELANRMARRGVDVIKVLMKNGLMVTINDVIDGDMAQIVAEELGHTVKRVAESDVLTGLAGAEDTDAQLLSRAPVVTIMGHVDHGKTSLLDALRETDVAAGEAGGITQHIGAYQVQLPGGDRITFLDTPGHAAFTAMRARGAKVTDIVVLVVAADDGVMPQTIEAIAHAKAAGVPLIVAVNKIDRPDANPQRVKSELLQHEIVVEDLGGDTQVVEVSAIKKTNLDKLEEAILLQAEVLDLKANPNRPADGAVIEAKLDKGRGPVATVLVQRGTLRVGDIVVAGTEWGRVRALQNERGEALKEAGPATPVEILGLTGVPEAGDELVVVEAESRAREVTEYRARMRREKRAKAVARTSLDQLVQQKEGERKVLPVVIKGDVQGSVEAIAGALNQLATGEVAAQVLQQGVGGITESDVTLAQASGAAIIAFNVRAHAEARERAKRDGVDIRYYSIIYNIIDDVKAALSGLLSPTLRETFLGNAEILEIFNISKVGKVAGCRVTEGVVRRGAKVRLIRDKIVIHEGKLSTLKRFKDEVKEVQAGMECGMAFEDYQDMRQGDIIECFDVEEIQRTL